MTNTMSKLEIVEAILIDLGFKSANSVAQRNLGLPFGAWIHAAKLVGVVCLDEETCWEAVLFESRTSALRVGVRYQIETGRVRLSNLSHAQFETVLGSLL